MKTIYFIIVFTYLFSISVIGQTPDKVDLFKKEMFYEGFPKTFSFRNDRFGFNKDYEVWENEYLDVNGVTKKYLREEVDLDPIFAKYANIFAENHPEKLMLVHLNGEGISIKDKSVHDLYFPGHWVYEAGSLLDENIDSTQKVLKVKSAKPFSEKAYSMHGNGKILGKLPHNILLVTVDENGNRDWDKSEYATIEKVNYSNNTLEIKRGEYFSSPKSFKKNSTYIAPIAGDYWGGNLMWYYNLASTCPVDSNGNQGSDIFLQQIKQWFGENGILKNLDGIGFDVNYFSVKHNSWDVNNDGIPDHGIIKGKNVWREGDLDFLLNLRSSFGPNFIITADGWNDDMQRAVGILNGMETEGLARPNDGYRQISRTINQHTYWNLYNSTKYKFSYITSKLNNPEDEKISNDLRRMGMGLASILEVAYTMKPNIMYPELTGGILNKSNWLGKPIDETIYPGLYSEDLLSKREGINV